MNTVQVCRTQKLFSFESMRVIFNKKFNIYTLLFCIAVTVFAYSAKICMPSFNADDIIQTQPAAKDYYSFLELGRWGHYIIYKVLFAINPAGPFGFILGLIILNVAGYIAAQIIGLESVLATTCYILISCISLYSYSYMTFCSTTVAYPFGILLAIIGLRLFFSQNILYRLVGIIPFACAPACYQPSVEVAATLFLTTLLVKILKNDYKNIVRIVLRVIILMSIGLLIYYIANRILLGAIGLQYSSRFDIDFKTALNYRRLTKIFEHHVFASGKDFPYFNTGLRIFIWALSGLFVLSLMTLYRPPQIYSIAVVIPLVLLLAMAPFCLAFASPDTDFLGPRAINAYSFFHAGLSACIFVLVAERKKEKYATLFIPAAALVGALVVFATALGISQSAYDEYLASRDDFLATNRIIYRIDDVIGGTNIPITGPIPLAVRYVKPINLAPRGEIRTVRSIPWAREWIFRQIDCRFAPVDAARYKTLIARSANRPLWPAKGSVYIDNGIVVVVIN